MKTSQTHKPSNVRRRASVSSTVQSMLKGPMVAALGVTILYALFMGGCKDEDPGIINICVSPTVIRTAPENGATNEPLSKLGKSTASARVAAVKVVTATFSTPMDARTITGATFLLRRGATPVSGTVSYSEPDTAAQFVTSAGLEPNQTYTGTITTGAKDLVGTALSNTYTWTFSTIAAGTPTLVSPLDNAVNQSTSPTLIWSAVPNADTYRLQVSTDAGFTTTVYNDSLRTNTSQVVSGLSYGMTYFWRVNSKIAGGVSAYSSVWSFATLAAPNVPSLISPSANAVNVSTDPTLTWNSSAGAETYRLEVDTNASFTTAFFNDSTITGTSQLIPGLTGATTYYWRVNAKNAAGTSGYATRNFMTIAPGVPLLISPVDGAVDQSSSPTLVWNAVANADTYRLQVSTNAGFTTTVYNDSLRTNTSQVVSGLSYGTTYFWRVNAKIAGSSGTYSSVWSFATLAAPGAPSLISPSANAVNVSTDPTLTWNPSAGAETYRLQVDTNASFTTAFFNDSTITGTSQLIPGLTGGTTYYWRVNAKNAAGTSGYATRNFMTIAPGVPLLISPVDGAVNQSTSPTLIWNAVANADTYRLQVSTNAGFTTTVYNDSLRTNTSQVVSGLAVGTTYFWRVNSKIAGSTSAYSPVWSFSTIAVPGVPVLESPLSGVQDQASNLTLSWLPANGASTYRLQVSSDSTFATTAVNDSTVTGTSQPVSNLLYGTTYYWRVNAKNTSGTSAYSTRWSFRTLAPPAAPVLVSPIAGAQNQSTNLTLSWFPSTDADTYRLQLSTSALFTVTIVDDSTITGTSHPLTGLMAGTTYYWRVNAKNAAGTSSYSTRNFTTSLDVPQAPLLSAPSDLDTVLTTSPTLSWNASVGAETYRLQVDTSAVFASAVFDDSTITGLSAPVSGLENGKTYFWRVNAKNTGGTSPYSQTWRFTVASLPPPLLGAADTYGIMATSAITSTGNSIINGDVSLDPGTSMTGFPPAIVNGAIHINDLVSQQARDDLLVAYNNLKNLPPGTTISAGADLGALYPLGIPPGTYTSGSTMLVSTPLVLDAGGNANAVWVFQVGSSLTTGADITLTGGADENNVYWVPTLDATIGVGTTFHGTIVAGRDVTAVTGSTINGRILAGATTAGTIALQTAVVNVPVP